MSRRYTYILCCLLAISMLQGCDGKKKINWGVSMLKKDKKPYGTYLAYESLKYYFPNAKAEVLSKWFRYNNITDKMKYSNTSLLVLAGLNLYVSDAEMYKLIDFAAAGNEVLIFASNLDEKLGKKFGIRKLPYGTEKAYEDVPLSKYYDGSENAHVLGLRGNSEKLYGYYGRCIKGYFVKNSDSLDTGTQSEYKEEEKIYISATPDTLGQTANGANFLRYQVGDGHITLHAAPLVLSNYFLLQPGNQEYLDAIWHSLPAGIEQVYWNEYYKRTGEDQSDFGVLMRYPATRNALLLALLGLLLYVLFEGKRRQRILPVVAPLENSSVSFVETVGRLYYNKGDHNNLAEKMIQHFLEWVRNHYYLNTNHLNEEFIQQLTNKSGQQEAMVRNLLEMIHEIRNGHKADEAYLYQLYNSIEQFYKNKS